MLLLSVVCNMLLHNSFEIDDNLKFKNRYRSPDYSSSNGSDVLRELIEKYRILPHSHFALSVYHV